MLSISQLCFIPHLKVGACPGWNGLQLIQICLLIQEEKPEQYTASGYLWKNMSNDLGVWSGVRRLLIGRRIGPTTYRSIVGDTRQWNKEHIKEIFKMLHPNKQKIVSDLVGYYRVSRLEVMENIVWWVERLVDFDGVREFNDQVARPRKKPERPLLAPRRLGEERLTGRRYANPNALVPRILSRLPAPSAALAAE